jgi:O-antigen biosynthesis protein
VKKIKPTWVALYAGYWRFYNTCLNKTKKFLLRNSSKSQIPLKLNEKAKILRKILFIGIALISLLSFPMWALPAIKNLRKKDVQIENTENSFSSIRYPRVIFGDQKTVIIFSPIDYDFRFQRPQQMAKIFVERGYHVIFVNPNIISTSNTFNQLDVKVQDNIRVVTICLSSAPTYVSISPLEKSNAKSIARLIENYLGKENLGNCLLIFQQSGWFKLAALMGAYQIVFDCMDLHSGFGNIGSEFDQLDAELSRLADLNIVTSPCLVDHLQSLNGVKPHLVRNGCDSNFFGQLDFRSRDTSQIILGYMGAIAEWFDVEFIEEIALQRPDVEIQLIGAVTSPEVMKLRSFRNIVFMGEIPYKELPDKMRHWDVGLIPFKITPLIQATNAVKMYEYAASGIPMLSTEIREVELASNETPGIFIVRSKQQTLEKLDLALSMSMESKAILKDWGARQSWSSRVENVLRLSSNLPKVSIVILMWNNAHLTIRCLKSVLERSGYADLEIILVDNFSHPNESLIVQNWIALNNAKIIFIRNKSNLGFAAGNNVGINAASGSYVVLLNNDTEVTQGWIWKALRYFKMNPNLGLLGPSTNNCGNEAKVNLRLGEEFWQLETFDRFTLREQEAFAAKTVAFFCVFIKREVIDSVGLMDEDFGRGYFEDDDYCRRVQEEKFDILIARDIFVYHNMGASFSTLATLEQNELFAENRKLYEKKWGQWIPHVHAVNDDQ